MTGLTREQAACLDAIRYLTDGEVSPTLSEIGERVGRAKSKVQATLLILRDRGFIDWQPRRARSIVILADQVSDAVLAKLSTEALRDLAHRVYLALADREIAT